MHQPVSPPRDRFFVVLAAAMLLIVVVGFAKTLFFRAHFETLDMLGTPELPTHLQIHGVILVAWFVLFLVQTSLIALSRVEIHRRMGVVGIAVAFLIIGSGIFTVAEAVPRAQTANLPEEGFVPVVFGNAATLVAFAVCFFLSVLRRLEPSVHRRFMAIASASITLQAGTRIGELFGLPPFALGLPTLIALLIAIIIHDLVTGRRIHSATIQGCGIVMASFVGVFVMLGNSPLGAMIIELLRA